MDAINILIASMPAGKIRKFEFYFSTNKFCSSQKSAYLSGFDFSIYRVKINLLTLYINNFLSLNLNSQSICSVLFAIKILGY